MAALAAALRDGPLDVTDTARAALARLESRESDLLAFVPEPGRRTRVLAEAGALEERHPASGARPALYGVPVGVKDVIRVDGLPTRAGSALPEALFAGAEAAVVTRLRRAGALVLGKSMTTEFAYFEPAATRNPRAPGRTPGGSSSGSAAAVAAGVVPLALGTQTVGSVIRPAAFCGVAALKPSLGRVPSDGVVYYSPTVDTVGWFARDVAGLVEAGRVLIDGWHEVVTPRPGAERPIVLGVPDGPYLAQAEPAALAAFEATLVSLVAAGVRVLRVPALADIEGIARHHQWLTAFEFAAQHATWFEQFGALYRPRSSLLVEEGRAVTVAQHDAGARSALDLRAVLHHTMGVEGIDAWASPAAPGPAPLGLGSTGSPAMNLPWTHAGLPVATVPAGLLEGCPLGLQLASRHGDDEGLLGIAATLEGLLARTPAASG